MIRVEAPSYPVSIFIAGRASDIEDQCRTYCDEVGLCVTCTPTTFVYTGGEEEGYIVGLINYPRFPSSPEAIWAHAESLAALLRIEADQQSYTIQAPDKTVWFSHREESRMTPDSISEIVAGLSKAQREALSMAQVREPHPFMPDYWSIRMPARKMSGRETEQLTTLGLVTLPICEGPRSGWPVYSGQIHDLGLAVRAALAGEESSHE